MAYVNRPYGNAYYEADKEVVREGPYGSYSSEYRVDEYGNRVYPNTVGRHNEVVAEVVTDVVPGHHHHHPPGGPTEYIERTEERFVDNAYDPYMRNY